MKRSGQIILAVLAWLIGLGIAALWILHLNLTGLGVLVILSLAALWLVRSRLGYILIFVAFLALGLMRGQVYFVQQEGWSADNLIGQKVVVEGRVTGEPSWNDDRLHEFYLSNITIDGRTVPGMMKIKSLVGSSQEGQVIRATGKVGHALGRASTQIWYAKVETVDASIPYPIRLKNLLGRGLTTALPREEAGFIRGLLFGASASVSPQLESSMRTVGLTHIIAVSGYNLTIIVAALTIFSRRRSRNACILALGGIVFFVVMTGAPASIVRAGVMAAIFLLVTHYRRELDPRVALAATVGVMTGWNPAYLYTDIGWQLSVLALVGVLWLAPLFRPRVVKRHVTFWEIASTAVGAYLATAPVLAYYFGSISIVAPLTNILILPIIPLIMLLGFIAALVGVWAPGIAFVLMRPIASVTSIVIQVIAAFAHTPHASELMPVNIATLVAWYGGIMVLIALTLRRGSIKALKRL